MNVVNRPLLECTKYFQCYLNQKYPSQNQSQEEFKKHLQEHPFQIIDHTIYAPSGQVFISKGTNMFAWEGISRLASIVNIWGFNTIRVPNYLLGSYNQPHPKMNNYETNHEIVNHFTQHNRVVIFSAHDRTGRYYQGEEFEQLKLYWKEMAREFKDNSYVWFNLHNEPGRRNSNPEQWIHYHRTLIDIIRAEGATNIIVVDGESWGQDFYSRTILNHAHEVMANNINILFSIHVYEQWNDHNIGDYLSQLHQQDIPVIVGEYGSFNGAQSTMPASLQMMDAVQQLNIGRIVWVFSANDRNDLTTGPGGHGYRFNGENIDDLTELGHLVWNDLQRSHPSYTPANLTSSHPTSTHEVHSHLRSANLHYDQQQTETSTLLLISCPLSLILGSTIVLIGVTILVCRIWRKHVLEAPQSTD